MEEKKPREHKGGRPKGSPNLKPRADLGKPRPHYHAMDHASKSKLSKMYHGGGMPMKEYDPYLGKELCNLMAEGANIVDAAKAIHTTYNVIRRWRIESLEFREMYTEAIRCKAEIEDSKQDELIEGMKNGTIDPRAAAEMAKIYRWRAEHYFPKLYGNNSSVEVDVRAQPIEATPEMVQALIDKM